MKIGTKSLLFGCHQFIWHPITVALAYRKLFRCWPDFVGWLCIIFHDVGYWGCAEIDGPQGKLHPLKGAGIVGTLVKKWSTFRGDKPLLALMRGGDAAIRCLLHSRSIAQDNKVAPSDICWADKYAVVIEPDWFYMLRTWLSGEANEFAQNAIDTGHLPPGTTNLEWHRWYRGKVLDMPEIVDLLRDESPVRDHLLRHSPRALKKWKQRFENARRESLARTHTTQHTS